jgi:hypothetical protein
MFTSGARLQQAGTVETLATGDLVNETTAAGFGQLQDIVTIDTDFTIRMFANDRSGGFTNVPPFTGLTSQFVLASPQTVLLQDLGGSRLSLVVTAQRRSDGQMGILTLDADGHGGFDQQHFSELKLTYDLLAPAVTTSQFTIWHEPMSVGDETASGIGIASLLPGRFTTTAIGGGRPGLALLVKATTRALAKNACPGLPVPPEPPPESGPAPERCSVDPECPATGPHGQPRPACLICPFDTETQHSPCNLVDFNTRPGQCGVPGQRCMMCRDPNPPPPSPRPVNFCETDKAYSYILVLDSSCGG